MGMSTNVVGFHPPDEKWNAMKKARDACVTAGVEIPKEVEKFFGWDDPEDSPGMEVEIADAITPYSADIRNGYDVDITKLPGSVTIVRFYSSY